MSKSYNIMNKLNQSLLSLGVVAVVGGLASQAKADISYTISNSSLEYVDVNYNGSQYSVLAGGIGITAAGGSGGPSSYVSVCSDFGASLYLGNTYQFNAPIPTSSALSTPGYNPDPTWGKNAAAAIQNASTLFANYSSALTGGNVDQAAGLQLAIWMSLYDSTGIGAVDTSAGAELTAVSDSTAATDAYAYLSDLTGLTPSTGVQILTPNPDDASNGPNPDGNPPQGLLLYAPVPEASTVVTASLLLLSFGMCSLKSFGKFRA
jgi:hypothetical protein